MGTMIKLEAKHYPYVKLFTVTLDQDVRTCMVVGRDEKDQLILEKYEEYNIGSAISSVSEFYVISPDEMKQFADIAYENGHLTDEEYRKMREA